MRAELRNKIVEENKYYSLLESNPKYRLQGRSMKDNKVIVGIIKGDLENYKHTDHLEFKSYDSWKEAYLQLND